MLLKPLLLSLLLLSLSLDLLMPSTGLTGNNAQNMIKMLNQDIQQTQTVQDKSELLVYRARQYNKLKEWAKALEDYESALELNHQSWIQLERSHLLMKTGQYELAYREAESAKEEVPALAREADMIMETAVEEVRKEYEAENPLTIIMDKKVDPNRKTRFDLMREQGVFTSKAWRMRTSVRKAKAKKSKTGCKPTKRRG